jgi:hypothetical protein
MELPVSPKSPKRQVTLGPDAPIREWEVERATVNKKIIIHSFIHYYLIFYIKLVIENKEYKEKAERLEKKVNNDLVTYENNRSSVSKMPILSTYCSHGLFILYIYFLLVVKRSQVKGSVIRKKAKRCRGTTNKSGKEKKKKKSFFVLFYVSS